MTQNTYYVKTNNMYVVCAIAFGSFIDLLNPFHWNE